MKALFYVALLSAIFAGVLGFGRKEKPVEKHAHLELVLENQTTEEIDQTAIVLGTNRCTSGIIGKGASAGYLGWQKPVGTNAIVRWRDGQKTKKEQQVSLVDVYDPKIDGQLIFTITTTNVVVEFKPIDRSSHFR